MSDPDAVVLLVRHGRTALNAAGVLRGRLDPPLDDVGEMEARALGGMLRRLHFTTVVTSPLTRAHQTAAAIAEMGRAQIEVDDDLADRDYGPWAGTSIGEITRRFGSIDSAPGVESAGVFATRVVGAVTSAAERSAAVAVVVVAHDAVNRAVLGCLVPALADSAGLTQRTGCCNRLERRGEVWSAPVVDALPQVVGEDHG